MRAVLGVSGSVAAYRAADLARDLMRAGFEVRVCLTDAAQKFVSPALFEALTGNPCLNDTFEEPERGRMAHIDWARSADIVVIAPATANTISRLAHGEAEDMLTSLCLAYEGTLVIAPAMNPSMYAHEATQNSLRVLVSRGAEVVEPAEGDVACGEQGQGKLAASSRILAAAVASARRAQLLQGQHVVITAGPTQEPIDDVRFLSNRSSGKMGAALARAALQLGARVTVVSGPVSLLYHPRAVVVKVRTAAQMGEELNRLAPEADWLIAAAAVADYRPAKPVHGKIRRTAEPLTLELAPNSDLIAEAVKLSKPGARLVGFAAEVGEGLEAGQAKLKRKGLQAIAINDVSVQGLGFESDDNALTLLFAEGPAESCAAQPKSACAAWMWETLLRRLPNP